MHESGMEPSYLLSFSGITCVLINQLNRSALRRVLVVCASAHASSQSSEGKFCKSSLQTLGFLQEDLVDSFANTVYSLEIIPFLKQNSSLQSPKWTAGIA